MKGQHRIGKDRRGVAWRALTRAIASTGMMASALFTVGVGVAATSAGADSGTSVTGSPYNGTDGVLDSTPAGTITHQSDLPSGNGDNIFGSAPAAKEQQVCPTIGSGPIDPKSDLTDFWIGEAKGNVSTTPLTQNDFLYLAWKRVATSGNANIDFELNQSTHAACVGPTVNNQRTAGDLLIQYNFASTTGAITLDVYNWVTSGACDIGSISTYGGCWRLDSVSSSAEEASVSTDKSFGEAVINLQASNIFPTGVCENLASAFAKSRASTSDTADLKDYISPAGVTVENCSPTTTKTTPSQTSLVLGGSLNDSVLVTGNATQGPPAGSVTFYVCAGTTTGCDPTGSSATKLTGAGNPATLTASPGSGSDSSTATSPAYSPPAVGDYCFAGVYAPAPGTAVYLGSTDGTVGECFQVTPRAPDFTTTESALGSTAVGNKWGDSATVTGKSPYGAPTGQVTFTLCQESTVGTPCTGGTTLATVTTPTVSGVTSTYNLPAVDDAVPTSTGTWCFNASYTATAGGNYKSVDQQSDDECFAVTAAASQTATHISTASVTLGANGTVSDTVTVTGNSVAGSPTGHVDFYVCQTSTSTAALTTGPCPATGTAQTSAAQLTSTGSATSGASSGSFTPKAAGSYCFAAVYSGDTNYLGSEDNTTKANTDANECVLVAKAGTSTSTVVYDAGTDQPWADTGEAAPASTYDTATVTGIDGITPGGSVTYNYFTNGNCAGTASATSTKDLTGGSVPASDSNDVTVPGSYSYRADYSGDLNYLPSTGDCESFIVLAPSSVSALKTESPTNPAVVGLGQRIDYTITLTNTGDLPATDVSVTDTVPAGTTFYSAADGGQFDNVSTVSWTVTVPAAANNVPGTATVHFSVTVNSTDTNGQDIPNSAYFTNVNTPGCGEAETCQTNTVHETVEFPVVAAAKTSDPANGATVSPGQQITYTITLTNTGLADASNVTVTDNVPAGTTFVAAQDGGTLSSGVVTWHVATVSTSTPATVSFTVSVNRDDTNGQVIPNVAQFTNVHTPNCDAAAANCSTNTVKQTVTFPIVSAVKSSDPTSGSTVKPGDTVTYTITLSNSGLADATNVVVTDTVPAGTTFASAQENGIDTNGVVSWTVADVPAQQQVQVTFTVTVDVSDTNGQVIPNVASYSNVNNPSCEGGTCQTNTVTETVEFPIVEAAKSADPASGSAVAPGDSITYTVTLVNHGLADATDVAVSDPVPPGTDFVSAGNGGTQTGGVVSWTVADVPAGTWDAQHSTVVAGAPVTVSFTVTVDPSDTNGQVLTNVATFDNVNTPGCDNDSCSTNTVTHTVEFPIISAFKSSDPADGSTVKPGDTITYTVTLTNYGLANATDVMVTDAVPTGTTFKSAADGGTLSGSTVTWTVPLVPAGIWDAQGQQVLAGTPVTVSFTVTVNESDTNGQQINNVAEYDNVNTPNCVDSDTCPTNTVTQTVQFPIITGTKTQDPASPAIVKPGDTITYTITLTNHGLADASNVVVTDQVPAGTTFVSATNGGTQANGTITWTIPTVAAGSQNSETQQLTPGQPVSVSFTVKVSAGDTNGQVIPNTAQFTNVNTPSCDAATCPAGPVQATVEFPVVEATKSQSPADGSTVKRGDQITYTIDVTNHGLADATNVTVTDAVPAGTTFVSATNGGTEANGTVTWTIADLAAGTAGTSSSVTPGAPATVSFTVSVNSDDTNGQVIPNTAEYSNVNNPDSSCATAESCPTNTVKATVVVVATAPAQATTTTTTTTTTTIAPTTTTAAKSALAFTGANIIRTIGGGLVLGTSGALLVLISRRRRRSVN